MTFLIIFTVVSGVFLFGFSMVHYVERKEIRRIKRYYWFRKIGLEESAYITYKSSFSWTKFCG